MSLIPPHNHDLEARALASVLIDPEGAWPVVAGLSAEAFHSEAARRLFLAMTALHAEGRPLDDHQLLLDQAARDGAATWVNLAYLAGLLAGELSAFYVEHYAAALRELHGRREALRLALELAHHAAVGDLSADDLSTLASQVVVPLDSRRSAGVMTHAHAVDAALAEIESDIPNALSTGLPDLDAALLGFEPGALYVLAARPAMGKTALGYSFALHAARTGHPVVVASLEMPARQLALRALATAASVDLSRIRQRTASPTERERLRLQASRTRSLPIRYLDATDQTGLSIARDARRLHAEGKLDLLLIDYLQLIESGKGGNENRVQEVSTISRNLKKLALELQIPVVVLSQLSRAVEQRPNHKPILSDLRESGAVEQDADVVMFIYRDEYYNPNSEEHGVADIIIGKQRNGPIGTVKLSYSAEYVRFGSLTHSSQRELVR